MAHPDQPYAGSSKQRLTDLINAANKSSLIEGIDFEYGSVEELKNHPKHNTQVRLIAKKPGVSDVKIRYTRLGIDVLAHLPPEMLGEVLIESFPFSVKQSIGRINDALGLNLTADEVENYIFNEMRETYPVRIKKDASYAWLPSEISVKAKYSILLSEVWQNHHLEGLYPPKPRR
jgi:hypothetical protein